MAVENEPYLMDCLDMGRGSVLNGRGKLNSLVEMDFFVTVKPIGSIFMWIHFP